MSEAKEFDPNSLSKFIDSTTTSQDLFDLLKAYQKDLEYTDSDIKLFERMNHKTLEDAEELIEDPILRVLTFIGEDVIEGFSLAIEIDKELRDALTELKKLKL